MKISKYLLALFLVLNFFYQTFGQKQCGNNSIYTSSQKQILKNVFDANEADYINFINKNKNQNPSKFARNAVLLRSQDNNWGQCDIGNKVLKIPVVVHIIHTGENIGVGYNRSNAWVNELIAGLNQKFRNIDNLAGAVDTQIEFELAKRDPNNGNTTGINRVNGVTVYNNYNTLGYPEDNTIGNQIRDLSRWPTDQYLNIWIVNFFESGIGGFGNFPENDNYNGTVMNGNYYPLTVHELGHVFNLYHTFEGDEDNSICPADNNCLTEGDNVCDTPPHKVNDCEITTCLPVASNGVWNNSLLNFMSYYYAAAGVCYRETSRFTQGQKDRMRAAAIGQFRGRLLVSEALIPVGNVVEAGIKQIKIPCTTNFSPEITIKNYGITAISTATIECRIDGVLTQTYYFNGTIAANSTGVVFLNPEIVNIGDHNVEIKLTLVNTVATDSFTNDNVYCGQFNTYSNLGNLTTENFENNIMPNYWRLNKESAVPVDILNNTNCVDQGTKILRFNSFPIYIYTTDFNKTTIVELEKNLDLNNVAQANITFKIAARQTYFNDYWKSLKIEVSTDCGLNWTAIYNKNDKYGNSPGPEPVSTNNPLHTRPSPSANPTIAYSPTACSHWRTETINLAPYLNSKIAIRLVHYAYKGYADNIYIDNFTITRTEPVCIKNPNTATADVYNNTTNIAPVGVSTQANVSSTWPKIVPSAALVLESKQKGFVITRLTTVQRDALIPQMGMLIYNIDPTVNCFQLYNGTQWKCIEKSCNQ